MATQAAQRYTRALFDLSLEKKSLDAVAQDMASLHAALKASPDLERVCMSPLYTSRSKKDIFDALADKGSFSPWTKKFLGLLAHKGRAQLLPSIVVLFQKHVDEHHGLLTAQVFTARALSEAAKEKLHHILKEKFKRDIRLDPVLSPDLLGGIALKIGSRLFDDSLKTKLRTLKIKMKEA